MISDTGARTRLDRLVADVSEEPQRIRALFPAAAREVGRGPVDADDPSGPRLEDSVRCELLVALSRALADDPGRLMDEVSALYRYGDADEKRAVLGSLHELDLGSLAVPLVEDALRANDTRLVAAALGPYGAHHLDDAAWRQGVLKCLFVGVPLSAIHDLPRRADEELARMVASYVEEREAAGRAVPSDAFLVLQRTSETRET